MHSLSAQDCAGGWHRHTADARFSQHGQDGPAAISKWRQPRPAHVFCPAFTLVEMLVVIFIISLLMVILAPAIAGIKGERDLSSEASEIAGLLGQSRAYAMANNTFVWVGIAETDVSKSASANPQLSGVGRVAVAVVASRDGTRGYDAGSSTLSTNRCWSAYNNGANFTAINKLLRFDNIHISSTFSALKNSGGLARPSVTGGTGGTGYILGSTNCQSVTPFDWPLGRALGEGQYSFTKVINFDPQGVARIQTQNNQDGVVDCMEIGLIPVHGNTAPATTPANVAAIQIEGMTGATRVFRP